MAAALFAQSSAANAVGGRLEKPDFFRRRFAEKGRSMLRPYFAGLYQTF